MVNLLIVGPPNVSTHKLYNNVFRDLDINVLGVINDPVNLKDRVITYKPDVVLIHYAEERLHLAESVKHYSPKTKQMFLLSSLNKDAVLFGLKIEVNSFIHDDITPESLVHSIKNLKEDQYVVSGKLVRSFFADIPTIDFFERQLFKLRLGKHYPLSAREYEIAYLVFKYKRNTEIAETLQLKEKTVRDYVSKMYRKFGVRKRTELIQILTEVMQPVE
ncbi:helix-turn-helix transcriptional regulator [Oceanobacillus kapialis]|uniref:transcriptional regulator n=1 Tax=Oceanobacillus kapialis TaxID=481353 RepID=UPI00384DA2BF